MKAYRTKRVNDKLEFKNVKTSEIESSDSDDESHPSPNHLRRLQQLRVRASKKKKKVSPPIIYKELHSLVHHGLALGHQGLYC